MDKHEKSVKSVTRENRVSKLKYPFEKDISRFEGSKRATLTSREKNPLAEFQKKLNGQTVWTRLRGIDTSAN